VFGLFSWERFSITLQPDRGGQEPDAGGIHGPIKPLIFVIEILSYFLRLISLTVRSGEPARRHMLIAFMGGELGVLVGDPWCSGYCSRSASRSTPSRRC